MNNKIILKKSTELWEEYLYSIYIGKEQIGEIIFKRKNHIIFIYFLRIDDIFQKKGYGELVLKYFLNHYKSVHYVVGETLNTSKSFWSKMRKKHKGQLKSFSLSDNCSSSFVFPTIHQSNITYTHDEWIDIFDYFSNCYSY